MSTEIVNEKTRSIYKDKMKLAIENFKQAELEGAETLAPETFLWAKHKIYDNKKMILQYPHNYLLIEEAIDDACAAAAQLLSSVRRQKRKVDNMTNCKFDKIEKTEEDGILNLVNEGGPAR